MKPVNFTGQNVVFGANQPEYLPLPAFRTEEGIVLTCWKLSFRERLKVLFTGRLFLQQLTFNTSLQPLLPLADNPLKTHQPEP